MLKTPGRFIRKEVDKAVDTLVGLIEPVMIVALGGAVGVLLISILGPIYNITAGIVIHTSDCLLFYKLVLYIKC